MVAHMRQQEEMDGLMIMFGLKFNKNPQAIGKTMINATKPHLRVEQ